MKSTDLAYAAGYIDGDGCFTIANNLTYHVSIVSIHKENIDWFHNKFEGTMSSRPPRDITRKEVFSFRFNVKGLSVLHELNKFLVEKKAECDLITACMNVFLRKNKQHFYEEMKRLKHETNLIVRSMKTDLQSTPISITPSCEDFAYLAGFIDAECSLDILKRKQPRGGQYSYVAQIQCNNTKFPFFKWAAERFGGNFYFVNCSKYTNRRDQMIWRLRGKSCYPILKEVHQFLNHKKQICQELLNLEKTEFIHKDRPSPNHPKFMEYFEPFRLEKESIYQKVCHLNNSI